MTSLSLMPLVILLALSAVTGDFSPAHPPAIVAANPSTRTRRVSAMDSPLLDREIPARLEPSIRQLSGGGGRPAKPPPSDGELRGQEHFSEAAAPPTIVTANKKSSPLSNAMITKTAWPNYFSSRLGQLAMVPAQCSLA